MSDIERRLHELEKACAIAYLDTVSRSKWVELSTKIEQAEHEDLHYRLVRVKTEDGYFVADVEVVTPKG